MRPPHENQSAFKLKRSLWLLPWLLLLVAACTPGAGLPPAPTNQGTAYRLGTDDRVRVITYGEEQLTNEFRVNDSGNIALPLLGSVRARGLTTIELSQEIAQQLRQRRLLRDPSVSVEVVAYRPVFVLGEVTRPGQYPYQPDMTMLSAVAVAGGFTSRAVQDRAYVVRQEPTRAVEGYLRPQDYVQPGDVIKIYERVF